MSITNTIGRRKTSVARIYLKSGSGNIVVNGRKFEEYFPSELKRIVINQPLTISEKIGNFDIEVNVKGGGITGQAEAVRHAVARALVEVAPEDKPALKKQSLLTRDSRMVERKKPGRRKARRRFQWVKR
ncbi:MAG: 30S ribosomal protein S9 [Bacteroidota bacterium]|nr:30S ribosomal protein S9 [Bacteroidota bacterium]